MDGSRFDAWTRRRVGLAAGGLAASLLGVMGLGSFVATKKRRKKRKRCKKLGSTCVQGGKRKCCGKLRCDEHLVNDGGQTFCCKTAGKSCSTQDDCCQPFTCFEEICQIVV